MSAPAPVLHVESLSVTYATPQGPLHALRDVDFSIGAGETLALVGESGSGKSTASLAILGLLGPEAVVRSTRIDFQGRDLLSMPDGERHSLRGDRISVVFQDPFTSLNPSLSIGLQVAEPLMYHRGMPRAAAMEMAIAALADVGLAQAAALARAYPHQLSGGMQQRVLIATALICDPDLVILDEPTTALDVTVEAQILDLLDELRRRRRLSMLFITHNLGVVNRICDSIGVLYAGQVLEYGPKADVLARPSHPYTKGLLASLPRLAAGRRHRLLPIPGKFPNLADLPEGCVFHPRCPYAEPRCRTELQTLAQVTESRHACCWKAPALRDMEWSVPEITAAAVSRERATGMLVDVRDLRKTYHLNAAFDLSHVEMRRLAGVLPWPRLRRPQLRAVDGVSLQVGRGEVLGLVGESGCGKSTLGRALLRLVEPTSGSVLFDGEDVTRQAHGGLRAYRRLAQIVFQNPMSSLNPRKTVGQTIGRVLVLLSDLSAAERAQRVEELLEKVGLSAAYTDRFPHQLSGGERQRVGIARALATGARFIVCDEPVSALDVSVQATVLNLLADLRDELGLSYLFISHDLSVVAHIADRIAVMYAGVLCEEGPTEALLAPPYHPYTEALLSAVPLPDAGARERLRIALRGDTAASARPTEGCRFHMRCPRKLGRICEDTAPPVVEAGPGHRIACHIALDQLRRMQPVLPTT